MSLVDINNNKGKSLQENIFFKLSENKFTKIHLIRNKRNNSLTDKSSFTDLNSYKNKIKSKIPIHYIKKNQSSSLINIKNNSDSISANFSKINNFKQNYSRQSSIKLIKNKDNNNINLIFNNFNFSTKKIDLNFKENKLINSPNNNILNKNQLGLKNNIINNNINSKNNIELDELRKKNEKINNLYNEKEKENKIIKNKLTQMKNDNLQLRKKIYKLDKENQEFIKFFEKIQKFIKILQNNGVNVDEILDNISSDREKSSESEDENINKVKKEIDNDNSIPGDNFKCHETYYGSKLIVKDNSIPKLNITKIKKDKNNDKIKEKDNQSTKSNENNKLPLYSSNK